MKERFPIEFILNKIRNDVINFYDLKMLLTNKDLMEY